jgi:hypothetical protein
MLERRPSSELDESAASHPQASCEVETGEGSRTWWSRSAPDDLRQLRSLAAASRLRTALVLRRVGVARRQPPLDRGQRLGDRAWRPAGPAPTPDDPCRTARRDRGAPPSCPAPPQPYRGCSPPCRACAPPHHARWHSSPKALRACGARLLSRRPRAEIKAHPNVGSSARPMAQRQRLRQSTDQRKPKPQPWAVGPRCEPAAVVDNVHNELALVDVGAHHDGARLPPATKGVDHAFVAASVTHKRRLPTTSASTPCFPANSLTARRRRGTSAGSACAVHSWRCATSGAFPAAMLASHWR